MEALIQSVEDNIGLAILIILVFSLGLAVVEFFYELYQKKIDK